MSGTMTSDALIQQLNWRYAVKKFDASRRIPADQWSALEQALVLAPSSFGLQPWRFVVVTDRAVREKLVAHSWSQRQVADASHLVVFAVRKGIGPADADRLVARMAEVRQVTKESLEPYRQMMLGTLSNPPKDFGLDEWSGRQVYIALGQYMAAAAMLGIDTCPMEGIEPAAYDEALGLKGTGYGTLCACPAGYRAADDKYALAPKVRYRAEDVIKRV